MPAYALHCTGCDHRFETFAHMAERDCIACPKCKRTPVGTDWDKTRPGIEKEWHGREATSLAFQFDPRGIAELKAEVPSAELNDRGQMVYRDNNHQRRVGREMNAALKRIHEEDAPQREAANNALEKKIGPAVDKFLAAQGV